MGKTGPDDSIGQGPVDDHGSWQGPDLPQRVRAVYDACTPTVRQGLMELRRLIFGQAARMPQIGPLTEELRWGQPAFLTVGTGAACSLRIGPLKRGGFGLFVHCQSGLIAPFQAGPGAGLRFDGTRGVLFDKPAQVNAGQITPLIAQALGYHLRAQVRVRRPPA